MAAILKDKKKLWVHMIWHQQHLSVTKLHFPWWPSQVFVSACERFCWNICCINKHLMLFKTEFMKQRGEVQTSGDDKLIDPDPISPGRAAVSLNSPLMVALLGRMVMAPTAASSSWWMGLFLDPQLSEPIHRKCPTWSARFEAFRIPLQPKQNPEFSFYGSLEGQRGGWRTARFHLIWLLTGLLNSLINTLYCPKARKFRTE